MGKHQKIILIGLLVALLFRGRFWAATFGISAGVIAHLLLDFTTTKHFTNNNLFWPDQYWIIMLILLTIYLIIMIRKKEDKNDKRRENIIRSAAC